ncbi:DAK1/DegV-like protein [Athelia psychrophila]|uniref:DAK1/DegV-like protein n=1 Tax=Athelia psychrophila TaxID=1759441 RepID=A0A166TG22_9AGAM|nr:DAK1/DegV-like protein [Fibularhizoctonia sp. CBS 109695]
MAGNRIMRDEPTSVHRPLEQRFQIFDKGTMQPSIKLFQVVHLTARNRSHVALLCGGGSGYEPAHAGFVGKGMLTAAVCINIFASPNASPVRRSIDLVDNEQGTLIVVKNYAGDVMNVGLSKEQYAALHPEKATRLKFEIVGNDVAVEKAQDDIVGRRGLAGTCILYKIAGALAGTYVSLDDATATFVQWALKSCDVTTKTDLGPGTAATESHLKADEIEIGMGIHNESGHKRLSPAPPFNELVPNLLELLTSTTDSERSFIPFQGKGDRVVLLVNNLGGLSELELGGVVNQARVDLEACLEGKGIKIERVLAGTLMTSLNMPGFSLTPLLLPSGNENAGPSAERILDIMDADTIAPGWRGPLNQRTGGIVQYSILEKPSKIEIG